MTADQFDLHYRRAPKNRETMAFVDRLDKKIDEIVGSHKIDVFEEIKKHKNDQKWDVDKMFDAEVDKKIEEGFDPNAKIITLPEDVLGELLKPMVKEIRENIYLGRNNISVGNLVLAYKKATKDSKFAFHVSPYDIKDRLEGSEKDSAIYFSTDIKRLFDQKGAKYLYAFRLNKDDLNKYQYGALDCFGKLIMKDKTSFIEIEGKIKMFDESGKDPAYRKKIIDELGAGFEKSYIPIEDEAAKFVETRPDDAMLKF
jgi:hypothetical protein